METSFFKFVWRYSRREQLFILALTFLSFPLVYFSLEIPKIIINEAIQGTDFPRVVLGFEFEQIPFLLLLCGVFLLMVVLINGIKWVMNVTIGMTGERMLRRMRFMLFEHVMRFPMRRFKTQKPGELIQSMLGEIEPLGGFIGEVIATPAFQGGLLTVYCVFIFVQDVWLGLAAVALYPMQAWLIPKLQARVIRLNKERAMNTRLLADTIAESVTRVADIQTNDTARWHMSQVSGRLFQNTMIRMALFRRKFTIKFINNFLNQLTPFFFYSIGGYFVIEGRLDFGSLVAVLAAYKDLAGPWKEVLNYVQRWADFNGRYEYVTEAFVGEDVYPAHRVYDQETAAPLEGELIFAGVAMTGRSGELKVPELKIENSETVAILGGEGGARETFLRLAAGLETPDTGRVLIGSQVVAEATLGQIGATLAFLDSDPGLVNRAIRDNLVYGLFRLEADLNAATPNSWGDSAAMEREARRTGNIVADPLGDWTHYQAAGYESAEAFNTQLLELVEAVGLADELFTSALTSRFGEDGEVDEERAEALQRVRQRMRENLNSGELDDVIEPWDLELYNGNASLLENILFAAPASSVSSTLAIYDDPAVRQILQTTGAMDDLVKIGWRLATEFQELVDAVGAESTVLDNFAAYPRADIVAAAELVNQNPALSEDGAARSLGKSQTNMLLSLSTRYVQVRDRLDVLDTDDIERLLSRRKAALELVSEKGDFVRFDEERFNPAQTIVENILGGKRRFDRRAQWHRLEKQIEQTIDEEGMRSSLIELGLNAPAGAYGGNLPMLARRRIVLVRALLKRPRLVILDGVWSSDTVQDCKMRELIRKCLPEASLLYAAADEEAAADAGKVYKIDDDGQIAQVKATDRAAE